MKRDVTRRPRLTEVDREYWARYARDIRPLPGRSAPALTEAATETPSGEPPAEAPPPIPRKGRKPSRPQAAAIAVGDNPGGVDRATWQRLRTGKLVPARTLDLHGNSAERALHRLAHFLRAAQADGLRCVEVITGRGVGEAGGVIRREFPHWLNRPDLRPMVLAATHPHPANPGAVRVLLRRLR